MANFAGDKPVSPGACCRRDPGDRALQECNLSTESPLDCGCIQACRAAIRGRPSPAKDAQQTKANAKNSPSDYWHKLARSYAGWNHGLVSSFHFRFDLFLAAVALPVRWGAGTGAELSFNPRSAAVHRPVRTRHQSTLN
jgi:hypothetical protein